MFGVLPGIPKTPEQAFAKFYSENYSLKWALDICKRTPQLVEVEPRSVEVGDTNEDGESDATKAAAQIAALVEEQRTRAPTLTVSELYSRFYANPANKKLVARAHGRSSPSAAALQGEGKW
jgi:hypothetical protein